MQEKRGTNEKKGEKRWIDRDEWEWEGKKQAISNWQIQKVGLGHHVVIIKSCALCLFLRFKHPIWSLSLAAIIPSHLPSHFPAFKDAVAAELQQVYFFILLFFHYIVGRHGGFLVTLEIFFPREKNKP